jgi:LmbE family N-acetylglucosaminyl deacetylase
MARVVEEGGEVFLLVVAADTVTFRLSGKVHYKQRLAELKAAAEVLRVSRHEVLFANKGFDGRMSSIPMTQLIAKLDEKVAGFQPEVICFPRPGPHPDYKAVWDGALATARTGNVSFLLAYEYPLWGWSHGDEALLYVDVAGYLIQKMKAFSMYKSQERPQSELNSFKGVMGWANFRGAQVGIGAAECFKMLRGVLLGRGTRP